MKSSRITGFAISALALSSAPALAQVAGQVPGAQIPGIAVTEATTPERQSVGQRMGGGDYAPLGLRAGSFLIYPNANLAESYNSNVFATQSSVVSDEVTSLQPSISINSDWNSNSVNFLTTGEIRRYAQQVGENQSNFSAAANGRLDVLRDVYFSGGLGYQLAHEDRTSPNTSANLKAPTEYQLASAQFGYVHKPGRIGLTVSGSADDYFYNNNINNNGTFAAESYRNRVEYNLTPRLSYEIVPGYHAFVQTNGNLREYTAQRDLSGFKQNSDGYAINAGTAVDLGHVMNGEIFAGYFKQYYDDSRFVSPKGVDFGGTLLWNITDLTSLRAGLARSVEETTFQPASSIVQTTAGVTAEHALLRNVLLTAGFDYLIQDYQGVTRTDHVYDGSLGAKYLVNRNLSAGLNLAYNKRDSNTVGNGFTQEIIMGNVSLQY